MGEHSTTPRHAATRPVPGPIEIPSEPVIAAPRPRPGPRRMPLRRRWSRRIRRGLRTKQGKWTLVALACIAVILAGLLSTGFLSSPAPSVTPPAALGSGTAPTPSTTSAGVRASASPSTVAAKSGASGSDILSMLKNKFPDNPLNHLRGAGIHEVVIQADSSEPVPILGWLIPTGLANTYGTNSKSTGHFSLSQRALGKGYLAAVFIQSGRDGAPVTCRVIVDGKVTDQETTSGAYGRTICLG